MSSKEILGKVHKMIPPMLGKFHKGMIAEFEASRGSKIIAYPRFQVNWVVWQLLEEVKTTREHHTSLPWRRRS